MYYDIDLGNKIEAVRSRLTQKLLDASEDQREDLRIRLNHLGRLVDDAQKQNRLLEPKVFLSFSGDDGEQLMKHAYRVLRQTKFSPGGRNILVETGMRGSGHPEVLKHVLEHMKPCCLFLGILTKEHEIESEDDEGNKWAPGAWVLLEAGMAIGLDLRCIFLIEKGIHKKFWFDYIGGWRQALFEKTNFDSGLKIGIELLKEHYDELIRTQV